MTISAAGRARFPALEGKTLLLCVGAAKSATSWIYSYLRDLPEVAVSPLKEVHFFDARFPRAALADADALALDRLAAHIRQPGSGPANLRDRPAFQASIDRVAMIYDDDAYLGHFARICDPDTRTICDVTPAYAVIGRDGFAFVKRYCADRDMALRLLFVMRDPVDRLWSQLRHMAQIVPDRAPLEAWADTIRAPKVLARSDYRAIVTDLDGVFGPDGVTYLFYEDLGRAEVQAELCSVAGAAYRPADSARRENETSVKASLPAAARAAFRSVLAPQYAFCRSRFRDQVPEVWDG